MSKCFLDGCISAYGPNKVYIRKDDLTDFEIWEKLEEGLKDRTFKNVGDDNWEYFKSDNSEVSKISYKVNHVDDGWGAVMFRNGSGYNLEVYLTLKGQNLGTCKF